MDFSIHHQFILNLFIRLIFHVIFKHLNNNFQYHQYILMLKPILLIMLLHYLQYFHLSYFPLNLIYFFNFYCHSFILLFQMM